MQFQRFHVLGVAMHGTNLVSARDAVLAAADAKQKGYACFTGVHGVSEAQNDPEFLQILNDAFLNNSDGMPLAWLGQHYVGASVDRVYGPDFMELLFESTLDGRYTHFLYGGAPGVADELKSKLEGRFPGVRIVGTFCPPFRALTDEEDTALATQVAAVQPDFFWVGLSTPKQERFMARYLSRLSTTVMFGVGAAFDFHAGRKSQAPRWIQRSGMEWFYRMCCEPRRLARRYLVNNPIFLWKIAGQLLGLRKADAPPVSRV